MVKSRYMNSRTPFMVHHNKHLFAIHGDSLLHLSNQQQLQGEEENNNKDDELTETNDYQTTKMDEDEKMKKMFKNCLNSEYG